MKINDMFEYKITREQIDDLMLQLNARTKEGIKNLVEIKTGFVELENGTRYAIKTKSLKITSLRYLISACEDFVTQFINDARNYDTVYMRHEWSLGYINPTHIDAHTLDYLEKPTPGYWYLFGRFRGV